MADLRRDHTRSVDGADTRARLRRNGDFVSACVATLQLFAVFGCDRAASQPAKSPAPATVATIAHEDQLNTIKLTVDAERRLGIQTAPIELRKMLRLRTYGGEIALPTGASLIVAAPIGGTLQAPGNEMPKVGEVVTVDQAIFRLLPLLSPERSVLTPAERIRFAESRNTVAQSQIDAAGAVQQAQVQVDAAKIALERTERLLKEQAGTVRAVDDAQAQLSLANKTLEAAQSRKKLVDAIKLDEAPGELKPMTISSPRDGIIRAEHAAPGEVVAAGAPLFEVMDTDPVWVRTAVYAGELSELAIDKPAAVSDLADRSGQASTTAKSIAAPPTAVALASSVDVYHELPNPAGKFRPGERVTVKLPLREEAESPTVPWSAVVHDINGGTWIYENTAPQTFVRRRVQVAHVVDGTAALKSGPAVGAKIVTEGVVELFGTEFGFAK